MIILGIDPGFARIGYGCIETTKNKTRLIECGVIKTSPNLPLSKRLQTIYKEISALVKKFKPQKASLEELFFHNNQKTALNVSQARGVILLALEHAKIETHEFTPLQVKLAITSYGRADKQQIQKMVKLLLNLSKIPKSDDAADALAIALCAVQTSPKGN